MFKVGKEINMTGLKEKQKINIPFHSITKAFGIPLQFSNSETLWKIQFIDDDATAVITNVNYSNNIEEETQWFLKAKTKETIERVKLILID
jgi:hypothetical protein